MKKFAYITLSFILGVLTSCTDKEEIGIIQHHDFVLNINTSSTYETWDLTSYQNFLGKNSNYNIGVTTLVYDSKGNLRDSQFSTVKTFQTIAHTIKGLEEGTYSIIVFETMVDANNSNKSNKWALEKTDLLDSVRVVNVDRDPAGWYDAFGYISSTATIGKDKELNLSPKGIGCIVNLEYENFEKSSFNYFDLAVKNSADGYFLKPNLSDNERYYYKKYLDYNTWSSIAYFWSKDILANSNSATYYTFETGKRTCLFGASKSMFIDDNLNYDYISENFSFNFETGKIYEAYCYYKGRPDVFESFIGLITEFDSWYSKLDKTMNPIYADPCVSWGNSVSYVKTYMRGYEIRQDITEGVGAYYMVYAGKYMENYVEYDFTDKSTGLYAAYVCILEEDVPMDDILAYLNESNYTYDQLYEEDDFSYHLYYDDNTYVAVMPRTFDDGTQATMVQYLSRAYSDGQGVNARTRAKLISKGFQGKSNFGLKSK